MNSEIYEKINDFSIAPSVKIKKPFEVKEVISIIAKQNAIAIIIPLGIPTMPPKTRFAVHIILKEKRLFTNFAIGFTSRSRTIREITK